MANFLSDIGVITWLVLGILSVYFIVNVWIFIWRFIKLGDISAVELESLELISTNHTPLRRSFFYTLVESKSANAEILQMYKLQAINSITTGLAILSMISSTAPFIGLFGTVVEILEAFYQLGGEGKVSFDIIAPIISKALIATAFGILTAIPAYSFYIILKRKAQVISSYLDMQICAILGSKKEEVEAKEMKITLK